MLIDRILYPITALGPGKRVVIWMVGCRKMCERCANPELRAFDTSKEMTLQAFSSALSVFRDKEIDGFTITGGEPFCQSNQLPQYILEMKKYADDILVFSGYSLYELKKMKTDDPSIQECISMISVMILGEYKDELNDNRTSLVASTNQEIVYENTDLRPVYEEYMKKGRIIENVFYGSRMISVGIHNKSLERMD